MTGLGRVIVGYREGDPRIAWLWENQGRRALPHKGCINCGVMTYFVESGQDAIRERDPEPICDDCYNGDPTVHRAILEEL